jgi:hypothetical protein
MAGTTLPSILMLVLVTVFSIGRYVFKLPFPLERIMIFPMAVVPNLFGIWNMLYVAMPPERRLPLGAHGALLPFIIAPLMLAVATSLGLLTFAANDMVWFEVLRVPYTVGLAILPMGVAVYYLMWKYIVSFFNAVLGIA